MATATVHIPAADLEFSGSYEPSGDVLYLSGPDDDKTGAAQETPEGHAVRLGVDGQVTHLTAVNARWLLDRDGAIVASLRDGRTLRLEPSDVAAVLDRDRSHPVPETAAKSGLAPVVDAGSRILVLGTLPGDESLRQRQYYAHPRNHFWPLLEHAFGGSVGTTYQQRLQYLRTHAVALWDVLESAHRSGSGDAAIKDAVPNDFASLFGDYPSLRCVAFNGGRAEALWRKHVGPRQDVPHRTLTTVRLPSSSPTPGKNVLPLEEKKKRWRDLLSAAADGEPCKFG